MTVFSDVNEFNLTNASCDETQTLQFEQIFETTVAGIFFCRAKIFLRDGVRAEVERDSGRRKRNCRRAAA